MFISQLTSTSGFDELHFGEKLFTALGATKERGIFLHDRTNWDTFYTNSVCKNLPNSYQNISFWFPYQLAGQ